MPEHPHQTHFSDRQEWMLLAVLGSIQFTNLMDFVILMPLGPQLMRVFSISPQQFGLAVSAYTFSAGVVGIVGALFIDRFDRRSILLGLYAGFAFGNLFCAVAQSYEVLLVGRVVTGAFGGLMGATVFAVVADVVPEIRRGAAMGTVMTSFSLATVAGVPVGLFLANNFGWHIPFFMLAGTSSIVLVVGYFSLPSVRGHIVHGPTTSPFRSLFELLREPSHINAFVLVSAIVVAGFSVIPYLSPFLVANVGLTESDLPYIYLLGGGATIFTSRFFGKLSDRWGNQKAFGWIIGCSIVPIIAITNLPRLPLWIVLTVTTVFMILTSGRWVPAMAMVTSSVTPEKRGSFMSVNSSIQQISSGIAAYGGGLILGKSPTGELTNFGIVGIIAVATSLLCIILSKRMRSVGQGSGSSARDVSFEPV